MTSCRKLRYTTALENTQYTGSWFINGNQINHHFSWAVVRTFVAMGCNKTYASGVNLHEFPKEMKDSRLLSVSMLWSSVQSDRILSPLSNIILSGVIMKKQKPIPKHLAFAIGTTQPDLPYVFVGDEAFPLLQNMWHPYYPGRNLLKIHLASLHLAGKCLRDIKLFCLQRQP